MNEWKPIETAPKGDAVILVYSPTEGVAVVERDERGECWLWFDNQLVWIGDGDRGELLRVDNPTHWMEIPHWRPVAGT